MALLNRSGRPEAKWTELIGRLAQGPVLPLEVSHFGWLDRGAIAAGLKGSFCVSGTTLAKYLRQMFGHWPRAEEMAGVPLALAAGNNPVAAAPAAGRRPNRLRQALGLPHDAFIAMRLGRPDPRKWSDLLILHGARLLADLPRLHFVFLSAPDSRQSVIRGDGRAGHPGALHHRSRHGRPLSRRQRCDAALRALRRILRLCPGRGGTGGPAGDRPGHALGRQCPGRADPRRRDGIPRR